MLQTQLIVRNIQYFKQKHFPTGRFSNLTQETTILNDEVTFVP